LAVSEIFLLSAYAFIIVLLSSGTLLIFGRGNKNSSSKSVVPVASDAPQENVQALSATVDSKIIALKERAKAAPPKRTIPRDQLEKGKKELRTLLVEKELVSAALTRLYEAEASGEITKDEREILGAKYREELKSLDKKIRGLDVFIEVGDLETLRDQLLQLVGEKIEAIEKRIERTQLQAQPLIQEILERNSPRPKVAAPSEILEKKEKPQVPDISDLLVPATTSKVVSERTPDNISTSDSTAVPQTEVVIAESVSATSNNPSTERTSGTIARRKNPTSDGQVEELQKELLEALDRLEKLDVEA
jgi:hypothetical protein